MSDGVGKSEATLNRGDFECPPWPRYVSHTAATTDMTEL